MMFLKFLLIAIACARAINASPRSLEEFKTDESLTFTGLWILNIRGRPGLLTGQDLEAFQEAVKATFVCNEEGAFYNLVNVTVRHDSVDEAEDVSGSNVTQTFSWPVSFEGLTNLTELEDAQSFFDDRRRVLEDHKSGMDFFSRRNQEDSPCPLPGKEDFLTTLSAAMELNLNIDTVLDIIETEEKDCLSEKTDFSPGLAIEVTGNVDQADTETLVVLADTLISTYNNMNAFGGTTCDATSRMLGMGNASVDTTSIQRGEPEERKLQSNGNASVTPTTAANMNGTEFQSSFPSAASTFSPTEAPTTRGADLFTIFVQLEGTCRGCPDDKGLFDDTQYEGRRLETNDFFPRLLGFEEGCYCPVGATEGGPTIYHL